MSHELEIEYKNLLTAEEFKRIAAFFDLKRQHFSLHHNDYLETETFELKAHGAMLRIREKGDRKVLTLKQPATVGLLETHQPLANAEAKKLLNGGAIPEGDVASALAQIGFGGVQLVHLGRLSTMRTEIPYDGGTLVLDHSFYLKTDDYELEYEVTDAEAGYAIFIKFLEDFNIPVRKAPSKSKRFYLALEGTRGAHS
ncbi:CYTH domain-containing protein [Camelliibacillus cellulosilyticus]|uniref:CYTH domain-containing protein n=1 Tax=Camelliibacillus cellulosilyticus TaxID=2174486 RepID=A0ABV9GQ59_9BACL